MPLFGDGELAVSQGIPELDSAIARAGNNLPIIGREGDGKDIVVVTNKALGGNTSGELPQAEGFVPRGRQGV